MKPHRALQRLALIPLILLGVLFGNGCASTKQVDWTARMGEYTFDQAVIELGPPTKQVQLGDGKTVAEWVSRTQTAGGMGFGAGGYGSSSGLGLTANMGSGYRERILRLTFGSDGKLENWYRNY
jgi:hypothetical protein